MTALKEWYEEKVGKGYEERRFQACPHCGAHLYYSTEWRNDRCHVSNVRCRECGFGGGQRRTHFSFRYLDPPPQGLGNLSERLKGFSARISSVRKSLPTAKAVASAVQAGATARRLKTQGTHTAESLALRQLLVAGEAVAEAVVEFRTKLSALRDVREGNSPEALVQGAQWLRECFPTYGRMKDIMEKEEEGKKSRKREHERLMQVRGFVWMLSRFFCSREKRKEERKAYKEFWKELQELELAPFTRRHKRSCECEWCEGHW